MMTERKHRCGGTLRPGDVEIRDERGPIVIMRVVPGLICDSCKEELIEPEVMADIEKAGTPVAIWFSPESTGTSLLTEQFFSETVSTENVLAA